VNQGWLAFQHWFQQPPCLWWPLQCQRVREPHFLWLICIPYATRFVFGRLVFRLPMVVTLHRCFCCLHFVIGCRFDDFDAASCREPFSTRCSSSFTGGSIRLSFPHFCERVGTFGIPFGGLLVNVVDTIGNGEIIFRASILRLTVLYPSSSPFLHLRRRSIFV
jgi:hypothetical protein